MKVSRGGYTIVEVLIFLAVSGVLLASVLLVFRGSQNDTRFRRSMNDLNSKVQSYINETVNLVSPYGDGTGCTATGGKPIVKSGTVTNQTCLFVGRALQFLPPGGKGIYAYAVMGVRNVAANQPASSLAEANISPIVLVQGSSVDLTTNYLTPPDISLKAAPQVTYLNTSQATLPLPGLISFYNDFATSGTQSASLKSQAYKCGASGNCDIKSLGLVNCIEETSVDCSGANAPKDISRWQACFKSNLSTQTARLSINANSGTVTTELEFVDC